MRLKPAVLDNPNAWRDGLLLSPSERFQLYLIKLAVCFAPSGLLALLALATGGWVVALVVTVIGGLAAFTFGSMIRSLKGALVAGVLVALGLITVQLILAWLANHPMLPGQ